MNGRLTAADIWYILFYLSRNERILNFRFDVSEETLLSSSVYAEFSVLYLELCVFVIACRRTILFLHSIVKRKMKAKRLKRIRNFTELRIYGK